MAGLAVIANIEAVVAGQPRNRALDHPPVTAEMIGGLDTFAGNTDADTSITDPFTQFSGIIGFVGVQFGGSAPAWATPRSDRRDRLDQRGQRLTIVGIRRRNTHGQRYSRALGQDMDLGAGFATVDRTRPGQRPPFLARTDAASITACDQSITPLPPSSSRTAQCNRRQRPASVHTLNRR